MRKANLLTISSLAMLLGCGEPVDRDKKEIEKWCNPDPKSVLCEQAHWRVSQCKADPNGFNCLEAKLLKRRQREAAESWQKMNEELDKE